MEQKTTTRNGVNIFTYPNPHLNSFYISLFAKGGSMYEDESCSGMTHFIEHLSIRNVNALMDGELYRTLDTLGLEFNATTYNEMVQFYISGAKAHFGEAVKIICKLLLPLSLTKAQIDTERLRIKAELREGDEKNSLANFTAGVLYPDTSLRLPILGTNRSLDRLTGVRLSRGHCELMARENVFFYLTGSIDAQDVDLLAREIESYRLTEATPRRNLAPVSERFGKRDAGVFVKNADYTMLRLCFDMDMTRISEAESDLLYDILFTGYNSKFFVEMSEKRGICYDVVGGLDRYLNIGSLYFTFELKPSDVREALSLCVELLCRMKRDLLSEGEIIKAPYVDNAYLLFDDPRELNFTFAYDCHVMNSTYRSLEDRREAYRAVTPQRIREISRMLFVPDNCTLCMKGQKSKTDTQALHEILLRLG